MKSSEAQKPKEAQKKSEGPKLSKKHLTQLLQGRKIKAAKGYINELKNSNPKAEKYIMQVLEEVFCQRKVGSATAYMYALVFYKNLLVSGELDYYEDNEFFPLKIHEAVSSICQYNQSQKNINQKGKDYFSYCVKIQSNPTLNEDLQSTGKAVVVFAMELLQSMAQWYKEDYFTGEQSHFLKKYNHCLSKGIQFPKKQEYVYIKEQEQKQFETNYLQLFEAEEKQENYEKTKSPEKQSTNIQKQPINTQKQPVSIQKQQVVSITQKQSVSIQKQQISIQKQPNSIQKQQINSSKPITNQQKTKISNTVIQKEKQQKIQKQLPQQIKSSQKLINSKQNNPITQKQNNSSKIQSNNSNIQKDQPTIAQQSSGRPQTQQTQQTNQKEVQPISNPQNRNPQQNSKLNLNEPKIQSTVKPVNKQLNISSGVREILNKVQEKKKQNPIQTSNILKEKLSQQDILLPTTEIPNKSTQKQKSSLKNINNLSQKSNASPALSTKPILFDKPQIKTELSAQKKVQMVTKTKVEKSSVKNSNLQKKSEKNVEIVIESKQKLLNSQKSSQSLQKKSIKRTEEAISRRTPQKSFQKGLKTEQSSVIQEKLKNLAQKRDTVRHKHRIFETVNKPNIQNFTKPEKSQLQNKDYIRMNMPLTNINENILNQNMSFSPKFAIPFVRETIRDQSQKRQKKSVPKTQKKLVEKSFFENQQLGFKLNATQNIFTSKIGQKNYEKFPMKTLSAWRCQKQIKKDYSPGQHAKQEILTGMLSRLQLRQKVLPFVPEYFSPLTLKMSGLRRSALEIWSFAESSQVFFNNNIVEARLMKPSRNSYILSLLNVSRLPLKVSLHDMKNMKYSNQMQIVGNSISTNHKTTLDVGCYMDIKFMFETSDLNFKFLPFSLEIDSRILSLQLPITLLDQCIVQRNIQVDQISVFSRKSAKIIKSQAFRMNRNDLPRFIRKNKEGSLEQKYSTKSSSLGNQGSLFASFILRMRQEGQNQNVLNCWLNKAQGLIDKYELSILFDSSSDQTQNFAKVITQLLTFLLYE